jgi:hypothetical protein
MYVLQIASVRTWEIIDLPPKHLYLALNFQRRGGHFSGKLACLRRKILIYSSGQFLYSHLILRSKLLIFSSSIFVPVVSSSSHRSKSSQLQILTPICFPSLKQTVYPLHETDHPRNPRFRPSLKESCDT